MSNILLIEPDSLLAETIRRYLAAVGHSVAVHSDPQAAVHSADKRRPDMVISELQLAARSGIEFLYEFRSYPDWQDIPVIIFTGLSGKDLYSYAGVFKELNIKTFLYKPTTSLNQLLSEIHSLQLSNNNKLSAFSG